MKTRTKLLTTAVILAAVQLSTAANATPKAINSSGISSIKTDNLTTTVNQSAKGTARINWQTIDTNSNESLNFVQPNSNSVVLNYIKGGSPTNFAGTLNANGKVVVINNQGVTFAQGSQVNVGALMATNANQFSAYGTGNDPVSLYNGDIYAPHATGYYLVQGFNANSGVNFNGTVNAKDYVVAYSRNINVGKDANINVEKGGRVFLASGPVRYSFNPAGKSITYGSYSVYNTANINQLGNIRAETGRVSIGARTNTLANAAINLNGVVDTSSVTGNGGSVRVHSTGDTNVAGTIDASAANATKTNVATVYVSAGRDLNVDADITNTASANTGHNAVILTARRNANIDGNIISSGNTASSVAINSGKGTVVDGGVQVGNGKATLVSTGATTINGFIDAQGKQQGSLPSSTTNNGGTIKIASTGNVTANGFVDAGAPAGNAGNVTIVSHQNVITNTKVAGNVVKINAAKDITLNDAHPGSSSDYVTAYNGGYPTGPGTGGTIALTANGNINVNTTLSSGNTNSGGAVTAVSKKAITINAPIITSSEAGKGGNVTLVGKTITNTGSSAYRLDGGTADGKVVTRGKVINSI